MEYMRVSECARQLGVTVQTAYRYCMNGTLPVVKIKAGKTTTWKIKKTEFEKMLLDGKL